MSKKPKILVIVGPTASGKTDLAIHLATKFNGEIISADSRQVYKGLDIGTGKVTKSEMSGISHHLIDVINPKKNFTVVDFKKKAIQAIDGILKRGKIPIVAGGTGFYIEAIVHNIDFPLVQQNKRLRLSLERQSTDSLHKKLSVLDLKRAQTIDPRNKRRLIRAIEIATEIGSVPKPTKTKKIYSSLQLGIKTQDDTLRDMIVYRLQCRMRQGMVEESRQLHDNGLSWKRMDELGLEYRYLARYLQGKLSKRELLQKLETEIWRYAKRQRTWFKRDKNIKWFERKDTKKIEKEVEQFLTDKL